MSPAIEKVEREIRKLRAEEMIELHERLIASIHEAEEELGLSPEWQEELKRRTNDILSGRVKGIPADETYKKIKKRHA